ncbi:sensor histidine kinase [Bacillus sp. FJAT-49705]|uniref:histidine kinase n=1 Tax=Cytobacillus citreus TaxID=2833586 RepID=A0ABS5NTV5_9BACI|nr:sensor histidine kinase [Cytobacillus citreus]MBS4190533.1 sensor histidine kinase [Cytobacillus citreus]
MLKKLYPTDQIQKYLLIDVIAIVFLIYQVSITDGVMGLPWLLLLVVLYLFCFYVCLWHRDWRLPATSVVGCMVLVLLAVYVDKWILLYGFIFADLLGRARRKVYIAIGIIGIAAMHVLVSFITEGSPFSFVKTLHFPFMIVQMLMPIVIFIREKANVLQEELDVANAQLTLEKERQRISRDLHDTLGQTLTMIKLKSELTKRLIEKDENKAKQELDDILNTSRFALKQVRELVSDMKFVSLEEEIEQSQKILQTAGIMMIHKKQEQMPLLSNVSETMLALSVREAITNIVKHSKAKYCTLTQYRENGLYYIRVKDDGNGQVREGRGNGQVREGRGNGQVREGRGNGIQSMKERLEMLQGEVEVSGNPQSGSTITLKAPIHLNGRRKLSD